MEHIAEEYCALTVAAVIVWHPLQSSNRPGQWSPNSIADAMKLLQYGTDLNFSINPLALHQGLHLFKKQIRNHGHELVSMRARGTALILPFMDLPEVLHGWDIIFQIQTRTTVELSELSKRVNDVAKKLVKSYCHRDLQFQSLVEIGAFLWQRQLPVRAATPIKEVILPILTHKRRKTSGELTSRQLSNCGKSILRMVSNSICVNNEDSIPYLVAAIHESRSLSSLKSISKSLFGDEDEINKTFMNAMLEDIRIANSVAVLPNKNITFSEEEKTHVLRIYDVVLQVFEAQSPQTMKGVDVSVASVTKMVLQDLTGYSELVESSIERWRKNRGLVKAKTGRKINKGFECAIWGQLMICEYEIITVRSTNIKMA